MIQDQIKTFEDACAALNMNSSIPDFSGVPEKFAKPLTAHFKLCIITEALNEGWIPDWGNGEWDKWYPWFYMDDSSMPGGFSFNFSDVHRHSNSNVSSQLCFKSQELSDYASKQFFELYKEYFVIE